MFNKNVMSVARFDFLNTLKSKGFIVLNVVLCLLVVVAMNLSSILSLFKSSGIIRSNDYTIEVWEDGNSIFFEALSSNIDKDIIKEVKKKEAKIEYDYDTLDKKTVGINIVLREDGNIESVEIISKDTISTDVTQYVTSVLTGVRNSIIEEKYNISEEDASMYKENIELKEVILSNAKNQDEVTTIISTFAGYMIFMLVMTITTTVASSVANEKTSKSAEYILSTIPAKDYLNGKVIAANLKAVLTIVFVIFYVILGLLFNSVLNSQVASSTITVSETQNMQTAEIPFNIIAYLVIMLFMIFITNTLISYIQAAFASKIKSISELDNAIMLPTVILAVAYFVSTMLPNTNNMLTYILSCVPILSMYILPTSYMLNKISIVVVLISFTVLITTLVIVYKVVTSKFKNNLLDLGKKKLEKEDDVDIVNAEIRKVEERKMIRAKLKKFVTCVAFSLILSITLGNIVGIIPYFVQNENLKLLLNSLVFMIYIGVPAWALNKLLNTTTKMRKETAKCGKQKVEMYLIGIVGLAIAQIINTIFVYVFNVEQSEAMEAMLTVPQGIIGMLLYILYLAVIPAIFEELLFRKAILNGAKKFGNVFAVMFTAIVFGLFHQNLQQFVGTTLIGIILAMVTIKTGDIKTAIALHFTNNFFATLAQIVYIGMETGTIPIITFICKLLLVLFVILAFIGIILLMKHLITKKGTLKISDNNYDEKISLSSIFTNYYTLILLATIILTTILNSKLV